MQSQPMQPLPQPNPPHPNPQQTLSPPQYEETPSHPLQQQNPPPQPHVIVVQSPAASFPVVAHYAGRTSHVLGAIQITGGVLAIVFQAILTGILSQSMYIGGGFWTGVFFIITGTFGVTAGKKKKCHIITYMVLAIIACFFTMGIFGGVVPGFAMDSSEMQYRPNPYLFRYHYGYRDYDYINHYDTYGDVEERENRSRIVSPSLNSSSLTPESNTSSTPPPPRMYEGYDDYGSDDYKAKVPETTYRDYSNSSLAFNSLLVIVGVVELVTLIWGSTLGCKALCCCDHAQQATAIPVQYANGQIIIGAGSNQMQVVPLMAANYGGPNAVYPMAMTASAQPTEEKQPLPQTPPPGYA